MTSTPVNSAVVTGASVTGDSVTADAELASTAARTAMSHRLSAVATELGVEPLEAAALSARGSGVVADMLARLVKSRDRDDELWLLLTALSASFPDVDLVLRARRALRLATPATAFSDLLDAVHVSGLRFHTLDYDFQIISNTPVVDVDFCARFDHNTGIQRVVRETMSRWSGEHDLVFGCWTEGDDGYRELAPTELRRVVDWNSYKAELDRPHTVSASTAAGRSNGRGSIRSTAALGSVSTDGGPGSIGTDGGPGRIRPRLIVPFRTTVVLPEVAHEGLWQKLSALARFSGNRVAMIGYDTIPIASADVIQSIESEKFAKYLTIVKNATRVAAISDSAADEFRGFVSAVAAQGVTGPEVSSVTLAVQSPDGGGGEAAGRASTGPADGRENLPTGRDESNEVPAGQPLVLIVGNQEPRKNLLAVIFAAETLWREGLHFTLRMIGGARPDYKPLIDDQATRLRADGFDLEVLRGAGDDVLIDSYRAAHFTIFPSTHEGYGLPVAESLAMGVPSITSDFGSTQQIADGGGCLTVDPRSDTAIVDAMRLLLTDDELHARLVAEAKARPPRTWNDYAAELWTDLVEPVLAETAAEPLHTPEDETR